MTKNLPENLRKLRTISNYSQEYVSDAIGVSLSTYSRLERGESEFDFSSVVKLSELYKLTLDELYNYNDPTFKLEEARISYLKKWSVPVTVSLDGTEDTLQMWFKKLAQINAAI